MCCDSIYAVNLRCDSQQTGRAHLAVETLLVDDAEFFSALTQVPQVRAVVLHNRTVELCGGASASRGLRRVGGGTLVMITSSSRGSSSFLMALPKMISERPFEYTCAIQVMS